jgi:hypothetical protein
MKKKSSTVLVYVVGTVLVIGAVAAIVVKGNTNAIANSNPATYSASSLSVENNSFDFGTILMQDGNVSYAFKVKNDGEEPVLIGKVYTSCMCTTASVTNASGDTYGLFGMPGHAGASSTNIEIGAGESATVEAVFDPAAHGPSGVGLADRSIYLETNSSKSPRVELKFRATVTR